MDLKRSMVTLNQSYALGLEYELHSHKNWGIGIDAGKLFGNESDRSEVVALPLRFNQNERWRSLLGPGY